MSKIQDEIIVDFNLSKKEINHEEPKEVKPKAKRTSKKNNIIVEDVKRVIEEPIQPVEEELKPKAKPKRISKKNVVQPIEEVELVEEVKPKKRAIKKNNIIVEDIKPVEEPVEEVEEPVEPVEEPKNIKTLEMVQCEKCNKKLTKNTLRYHHQKNCPGKPIDKNLPVKRRIKKKNQK